MKIFISVLMVSLAVLGCKTTANKDIRGQSAIKDVEGRGDTGSVSEGYLVNLRNQVYYLGLTAKGIDIQLPVEGYFEEKFVSEMNDCMAKKTTHTIEVTTQMTERQVPSDIPNVNTTFHDSSVTNVRCVAAEGYLAKWRQYFGAKGDDSEEDTADQDPDAAKGYIADNHGVIFFAGLRNNVDIQLPLSDFSKKQTDAMYACMSKKETHCIEVKTETTTEEVPTNTVHSTTFHNEKVVSVKCVYNPGFLDQWRSWFLNR